jgi:lysozyme
MANEPQRPAPIEPMETKSSMGPKSKAAIAIAAAVAIAAPLAQQWEGYRGKAYLDPVKVLTQCYGETVDVDPARIYSKDECAAKLRKRMAANYAPPILKCIPSLVDHHVAFGAVLDASYNAGPVAVCKSPMARAFNAGDYKRGCKALLDWYVTAKDRKTGVRVKLRGLVNRRAAEYRVCVTGL